MCNLRQKYRKKAIAFLGDEEKILQGLIKSENKQKRIGSINQAANYEEASMDTMIEALIKDKSFEVRKAVYLLLRKQQENKAKEVLCQNNLFFQCISTIKLH